VKEQRAESLTFFVVQLDRRLKRGDDLCDGVQWFAGELFLDTQERAQGESVRTPERRVERAERCERVVDERDGSGG
jgi:hypothetical protein